MPRSPRSRLGHARSRQASPPARLSRQQRRRGLPRPNGEAGRDPTATGEHLDESPEPSIFQVSYTLIDEYSLGCTASRRNVRMDCYHSWRRRKCRRLT
jgi:hypothetical protein